MQLYTEQDFVSAKKAYSLRIAILAVMIAVVIAAMIVFMTIARSEIATVAMGVVGVCLCYAFISIKLMPWFHYQRYLKDMQSGRSRETEAWFVSCSDSIKMSDGVAFHEMIVRIGDGEDDERLFLWDDDKELPKLTEGQKVKIRSFGNYVMELNA